MECRIIGMIADFSWFSSDDDESQGGVYGSGENDPNDKERLARFVWAFIFWLCFMVFKGISILHLWVAVFYLWRNEIGVCSWYCTDLKFTNRKAVLLNSLISVFFAFCYVKKLCFPTYNQRYTCPHVLVKFGINRDANGSWIPRVSVSYSIKE